MDWSLMNPYAAWPFLRNTLYFKNPRMYYFGIGANTLLRSTWVLYVVLEQPTAYAPLVSFGIATAEVFRRFIWCFFRMENEHKGNVEAMRAYRDPKLPYRFRDDELPPPPPITSVVEISAADDLEAAVKRTSTRSTLHRFGRTLSKAYRSDYERRQRSMEDDHDDDERRRSDEGGDARPSYGQEEASCENLIPGEEVSEPWKTGEGGRC
ncbi:EXS family-domain-containing protein [Sphaerosporella brunnea]|uniref:EXS family-domain-containing protein n=1 Tax=Sphaerosporella brunnea TaxID=1250544 RepID=A0A5J5F4E9_9PEZI|nr:EXS family-domain-containing protein [Sphaerosporella brunnea]